MKRIWVFGILAILLTFTFVTQNISIQRNNALLAARANIDDLAQFLAVDMNRNLFGLSQVFLGIHNVLNLSPQQDQEFSEPIKEMLMQLLTVNPFVTAFTVLNSEGRIIHWTGDLSLPDVSDRNYFTVHQEYNFQGLFITRPFASRVHEDQKIFAVSESFRNPDESLKHVIVAIIDLEYFRSKYSDLPIHGGETIALFSPLGDIYTRIPDHDRLAGKQLPAVAEQTGDYSFKRTRSPLDDRVRGISMRRLGEYPLIVAATYDEEISLAEWRQDAVLTGLFGFIVCVVFSFLTLIAARFHREQALNREKLLEQATTDALTHLANRRHAVECANLEIKKAQRQALPLSFVLMDLDHFKKINDGYGHETGDQVLLRVARALRRFCRQTDLVSRFGGEEFLLILPGTDLTGAQATSEKIRRALEEDLHKDFAGLPRVTASFGVAQWQAEELDFKDTLRRADRALYEAKESGRNCIRAAVRESVAKT